jgi:hypothetical protein
VTLRDLTPEQMAEAADSLAHCIRKGAFEDAAGWVAELYWSLLRHETKRRVELTNAIRRASEFLES